MNGPDPRTREARVVDNARLFLRLAKRPHRLSKQEDPPAPECDSATGPPNNARGVNED